MWALFVNRIRTVAGRGQGMQLRRVFHEIVEHLETLRHRSGIAYSQPHACTGAITCHYDKSFNSMYSKLVMCIPVLAVVRQKLRNKDSNHATVAFRCLQAKMMLEDKLQGKRLSFSGRMLLGDNPHSTHRAPWWGKTLWDKGREPFWIKTQEARDQNSSCLNASESFWNTSDVSAPCQQSVKCCMSVAQFGESPAV